MSEDPNSDGLFVTLEVFFGDGIHQWPMPNPSNRLIVLSERVDEDRINAALEFALLPPVDEGFRRRWWEEYHFGQIYEDAGGFLWRCWCRAMQVPNVFLARYGRQAPQGDA